MRKMKQATTLLVRRRTMNYQELFSSLFIIIAVLVVLVNIITEVAKKIFTFTNTTLQLYK